MDNNTLEINKNIIEGIQVLKSYSLRDIEQQTHIDMDTIEYIIKCDFDKLRKNKTKAMIKILEREYKIDLSEWVRLFDEHCNTLPAKEENHMKVKPTLKKYDQEAMGGGSGFKWIVIILVIFILICVGIFIKFPDMFNFSSEQTSTSDDVAVIIDNSKPIKTNDTLVVASPKVEQEVVVEPSNKQSVEANTDTPKTDTAESTVEQELQTNEIQTPQEEVSLNQEENKDEALEEEIKEDLGYEYISNYGTKEVKVKPLKMVWFNFYDMKTKKTKTFTSTKPFTITEPVLVLTGNSLFELEAAGQKIDFEDKSLRRRFYFDGDSLKIVDEENYNKIKQLK